MLLIQVDMSKERIRGRSAGSIGRFTSALTGLRGTNTECFRVVVHESETGSRGLGGMPAFGGAKAASGLVKL